MQWISEYVPKVIKNDVDEFLNVIPMISLLDSYGRKHPNTYEIFEEGNIKFLISLIDAFDQ